MVNCLSEYIKESIQIDFKWRFKHINFFIYAEYTSITIISIFNFDVGGEPEGHWQRPLQKTWGY